MNKFYRIIEDIPIYIGLSIFGLIGFSFLMEEGIVNKLFGLLLSGIFCFGFFLCVMREILYHASDINKKDGQ
jgi:hypothetical protein